MIFGKLVNYWFLLKYGVVRRIKTSHLLSRVDSCKERLMSEKRKFIVRSGLLVSSILGSFRRTGIVIFFLFGIFMNFIFIELFLLIMLGFFIAQLKGYRFLNRILRLRARY